MFFSKNDFQKIELYFKDRAKKDTDFPLTQSVTNEDTMAIVQDGVNRRISLNVLFELFRTYMEANYVEDPNWDDHLAAILNYMQVGGIKDIVESFGTVTYTGTTVSIPYLSSRINVPDGSRSNSITLNAANANSAGLMTKDMFGYVDKVRSELALEALLRTGLVRDLSIEDSRGNLYIRHTNSAFGTPVGTYEDILIPTVTNAHNGLVPSNLYASNAWLADNFLNAAYIVANKDSIQQLIAHKNDYALKTDRASTLGLINLSVLNAQDTTGISVTEGVYIVKDGSTFAGTLFKVKGTSQNEESSLIFITNYTYDVTEHAFVPWPNVSSLDEQIDDYIYLCNSNGGIRYGDWKGALAGKNILLRDLEERNIYYSGGTYNVISTISGDVNTKVGTLIISGRTSDSDTDADLIFITNLKYDPEGQKFTYPSDADVSSLTFFDNIYISHKADLGSYDDWIPYTKGFFNPNTTGEIDTYDRLVSFLQGCNVISKTRVTTQVQLETGTFEGLPGAWLKDYHTGQYVTVDVTPLPDKVCLEFSNNRTYTRTTDTAHAYCYTNGIDNVLISQEWLGTPRHVFVYLLNTADFTYLKSFSYLTSTGVPLILAGMIDNKVDATYHYGSKGYKIEAGDPLTTNTSISLRSYDDHDNKESYLTISDTNINIRSSSRTRIDGYYANLKINNDTASGSITMGGFKDYRYIPSPVDTLQIVLSKTNTLSTNDMWIDIVCLTTSSDPNITFTTNTSLPIYYIGDISFNANTQYEITIRNNGNSWIISKEIVLRDGADLLKYSVLNAIDDNREGPHMSLLKGVSIKLPINITETTARSIFSSGQPISIIYREEIKTSTTGVFVLTDANNANYTYDFKNCTVEDHDGICYLYKQGQYT